MVRVSSTGDGEAELVDRLPIGTRRGQNRAVVMSLGRGRDPDGELPDLAPGDLLEVCAELEVTLDLTPKQARDNAPHVKPTGVPYDFSPEVAVQLLLASSPNQVTAEKGKAIEIGKPRILKVNHDQHHAVIVFDGSADGSSVKIPGPGLGWGGRSFVNVVLAASHAQAKPGNLLLIGQNEPDGSVGRNMSSLCVVRSRPASHRHPSPKTTTKLVSARLPIQGGVAKVVYSMPLAGLEAGEQLRIRADLDSSVEAMGYKGRVKTEVFLAERAGQKEPLGKGYAATVASAKGKITKGNGSNCLPGPVMRFSKVGTLAIEADADRTLFVNVVAIAGDPEKRGIQDSIAVLPTGQLRVVRYPAAMRG